MTHIRHILILLVLVAFIATLPLGYAQNNPPIAQDDTASTFSGVSINLMVASKILNNDFDPDGDPLTLDTLIYTSGNGIVQNLGPGILITYTPDNSFYGIDTLTYVVCDTGAPVLCDTALIIITVNYKMYEAFEYLDINMIKARYNANGSDFWNQFAGEPSFEVPKGGGRHTIFISGLWIGGKDAQDSLHLAATRYNSNGQDIYTGPIMDTAEYSFSQDSLWNRLWKVNKSDIDYHIANWSDTSYVVPEVILNWPAHGDLSKGQALNLAPFIDVNGNMIYEPMSGDYPKIRGDQALYFIRNDDRGDHMESGAAKMKIEIHGMAYGFNTQGDALDYTVFVNYQIVNRSGNDYDSTYLGINFDPDIGDYSDDYIECDVKRGSVIGYNGLAIDGTGAPNHYGASPPAQSLVYLKGPLMDPDGIDNLKGSCDESINGFGFGDSIIDNECFGMTHFMYYCNPGPGCNGAVQGDPDLANHYYNLLTSKWKDDTHLKYGGPGHIANCTSCENTNFMLPGSSDSCNWGTGGVLPADTAVWNESTMGSTPNDRRGISSMGPFTFNAGDTIEIDIAYVYGRDTTVSNPYASVIQMNERIDTTRSYFNNKLSNPEDTISSTELHAEMSHTFPQIILYPNPATQTLNVEISDQSGKSRYAILDLAGRNIQSGTLQENSIDISSLGEGIFILRVLDGERTYHKKFVKM